MRFGVDSIGVAVRFQPGANAFGLAAGKQVQLAALRGHVGRLDAAFGNEQPDGDERTGRGSGEVLAAAGDLAGQIRRRERPAFEGHVEQRGLRAAHGLVPESNHEDDRAQEIPRQRGRLRSGVGGGVVHGRITGRASDHREGGGETAAPERAPVKRGWDAASRAPSRTSSSKRS